MTKECDDVAELSHHSGKKPGKNRMKTRLIIILIVAVLVILTVSTICLTKARKGNQGSGNTLLISSETTPFPVPPNWMLQSKVQLLQNAMEYTFSSSDQIGGHLGHISLHCNSEKLSKVKTMLSDIDQPLDTKMVALAVSSIAIGCRKTALFVGRLLVDTSEMFFDNTTDIHGPEEKASLSCDLKVEEVLKGLFNFSDRLIMLHQILSPSLFLTLGCQQLGRNSLNYLLQDSPSNVTDSTQDENSTMNFLSAGTPYQYDRSRGVLIMNYVNQHKIDPLKTHLKEWWNEVMMEPSNKTKEQENDRNKRNVPGDSVGEYFKAKINCSIEFPLGITLYSLSKLECLQLCLDEDSCESAGYTNDNSQICHLNVEIEKDVDSFFTCGETENVHWDYFEKIEDINYFVISSKHTGKVLQAKSDTNSVEMMSYNGNDNQLWFWKGDAIHSKKYDTKVLDLYYTGFEETGWGLVHLGSYLGGTDQRWNYYENGSLTSQYKNLRLDVKYGNRNNGAQVGGYPDNGAVNQKWTLSLDRVYFVITSRHSGKVLDASVEDVGRVYLGWYHGDDNQLWFWDDDSIRSKRFPDKVLDLHMAEFERYTWGKVYLYSYHGGDNQRWKIDGDNVISLYKALRLGVKSDRVGGSMGSGLTDQRWSVGGLRADFFILNKETGKVLEASSRSGLVLLQHYNRGTNQLWFWDEEVIRNKKYPDRVMGYFSNHLIYLSEFHGGKTQTWKYENQYLLSTFDNLSIELDSGKTSVHMHELTSISAQGNKPQKWSFNLDHDYFTLTSRQNAKVLDASPAEVVQMWYYHGGDNQLWFWDDDSIRSKKYHSKVLDLHMADYERDKWGKIYLYSYNGGDNQRWRIEGDSVISFYKDLRLDVKGSSTANGALVGGSGNTGKLNQMWGFNLKERIRFSIRGVESGKVLDVLGGNSDTVGIHSYHGKDNQLWFWDGESIRSEKYPDKVLDLHMDDYKKSGWGKIYLNTYHGGPNQLWVIRGESVISRFQNLRMDVFGSGQSDGTLVGGYPVNWKDNQKWTFHAKTDVETNAGSNAKTNAGCIDKTEQRIYDVVQWIPLIGTLWDLGSSIGYGIAGCTDVARERAISFGIGIVLDVGTVFTGGAATGALSVVKAGIKNGIKLGFKQGVKVTVRVTKQSIKSFLEKTVKNAAKNGVKQTVKKGIKKTGKLIVKESIVDPALFLKNVGKMSKTILVHPRTSVKQWWKVTSQNIDNLKQIKNQLKEYSTPPKVRCKRGNSVSCLINRVPTEEQKQLLATKKQTKVYNDLLSEKSLSARVDKSADRYSVLERKEFSPENKVIEAEGYAIHQYTSESSVNRYTRAALGNEPLYTLTERVTSKMIAGEEKQFEKYFYQATLIQDYLKKHPLKGPKTVYRYEPGLTDRLYVDNEIYTSKSFMSTSQKNARIHDHGLDLTDKEKFPVELTIHLKNSGSDISHISKYPSQEEVLIPIGTKFKVKKQTNANEPGIIKVTLTEIE